MTAEKIPPFISTTQIDPAGFIQAMSDVLWVLGANTIPVLYRFSVTL